MVALEVISPVAYEGGEVAVSRGSAWTPYNGPVLVTVGKSGSATFGEDYTLSVEGESVDGVVTIPRAMSAELSINPIATPTMERTEWVTLRLEPANALVIVEAVSEVVIDVVEHGPSPGATYHVRQRVMTLQTKTSRRPSRP